MPETQQHLHWHRVKPSSCTAGRDEGCTYTAFKAHQPHTSQQAHTATHCSDFLIAGQIASSQASSKANTTPDWIPLTPIGVDPRWRWCGALAVRVWLAERAATVALEQEALWEWTPLGALLQVAVAQIAVVIFDDQPSKRPLGSNQQQKAN